MSQVTMDIGSLIRGLSDGAHKKKMSAHAYQYRHMGQAIPTTYWGKSLTGISVVPARLDANMFVGFVVWPIGVNLVSKVAQKLSPTYSGTTPKYVESGIWGALTLAHYLLGKGQSPFWFGAVLGQFPTVAGYATDAIVDMIKPSGGMASSVGAGGGLLTSDEIDALKRSAMASGVGSVLTDETDFGTRSVGSPISAMTEFTRGMRSLGMNETGYPNQVGSTITELVEFGRKGTS